MGAELSVTCVLTGEVRTLDLSQVRDVLETKDHGAVIVFLDGSSIVVREAAFLIRSSMKAPDKIGNG